MTVMGAMVGLLGIAFVGGWLLLGGDDAPVKRRHRP